MVTLTKQKVTFLKGNIWGQRLGMAFSQAQMICFSQLILESHHVPCQPSLLKEKFPSFKKV